jgi:hypothetical protein
MTPDVRTVFVVTRTGFGAAESWDGLPLLHAEVNTQARTEEDRGDSRIPEAVFADRMPAEREASRREFAARELLNPFTLEWGHFESLTSRTHQELRAELLARGLTPPAPVADPYQDERNLAQWWEAECANWTAALRAELWELFDKVKLYDVQEVPFE